MSRSAVVIAGAGTAFVLLLLFMTLRSTRTPLRQAPELRAEAQRVCQDAVRAGLPEARFPFDASVEERDSERLRLSGSVDAGPVGQAVRRNFECVVRLDRSGASVAESVQVWQSH